MKFNGPTALYFLLIHVGALAAPLCFSWSLFAVFMLLSVLGGLSITLGYHRMLTHGSFQTYPWLRRLIAFTGSLAGQGAPLMWVAVHRKHHKFSDVEGDPHSPVVDSLPYAHMGWMLHDLDIGPYENWCPDLLKDPFIKWIEWHYAWILFGSGLLIGLVCGWPMFVWGFCARIAFTNNSTWAVNSLAHRFGYMTYSTRDNSRNLWPLAIITLGESWHHNHHAIPRAANHGQQWWEIDITYYVILLLGKLGLAWNIVKASNGKDH